MMLINGNLRLKTTIELFSKHMSCHLKHHMNRSVSPILSVFSNFDETTQID